MKVYLYAFILPLTILQSAPLEEIVVHKDTGAKGCPGALNAAPSVLSLDSGIFLNITVTKRGWLKGDCGKLESVAERQDTGSGT